MAQQFSADYIAKIAPNYRGKPERFDPHKVKSRKGKIVPKGREKTTPDTATKHSTQTRNMPKVLTLPKPTLEEQNKMATGQRNESIINQIYRSQSQEALEATIILRWTRTHTTFLKRYRASEWLATCSWLPLVSRTSLNETFTLLSLRKPHTQITC